MTDFSGQFIIGDILQSGRDTGVGYLRQLPNQVICRAGRLADDAQRYIWVIAFRECGQQTINPLVIPY